MLGAKIGAPAFGFCKVFPGKGFWHTIFAETTALPPPPDASSPRPRLLRPAAVDPVCSGGENWRWHRNDAMLMADDDHGGDIGHGVAC
jgi:hypothetical protein